MRKADSAEGAPYAAGNGGRRQFTYLLHPTSNTLRAPVARHHIDTTFATLASSLNLTRQSASRMPVNAAQKTAIEEVINALTGASSRRSKRKLAEMFLDLVNKESWPEYYQVLALTFVSSALPLLMLALGYTPASLH